MINGTPYTFTVVAQNAMGPSPASAPSAAILPGCGAEVGTNVFCDGVESTDMSEWDVAVSPPGPPTDVVAVAGEAQATVTFVAPLDAGGSPITGYTVTSNPAGGVDSNAGALGLSHVVTGLVNGTPYTFTVRATNASGEGSASRRRTSSRRRRSRARRPPSSPWPAMPTATVAFVAPLDDGGSAILCYTVTPDPITVGWTDNDAGSPCPPPRDHRSHQRHRVHLHRDGNERGWHRCGVVALEPGRSLPHPGRRRGIGAVSRAAEPRRHRAPALRKRRSGGEPGDEPVPSDPMPHVYLLRCRDGSLYAGAAVDLEKRLREHRAGRASRYTRSRLPVELAWSSEVESWSAALTEEARIKSLPRRAKELLIAAPATASHSASS